MKNHLLSAVFVIGVFNVFGQSYISTTSTSPGNITITHPGPVNIDQSLWVNNGGTISSDFADNSPNYSWNYNLMVRNNNNANNTFSRLSFVSQSGGFGAISVQKTDTYTGDMYFQVRNGPGFYQTPMIIKSNGNIGIGTSSPGKALEVIGDISLPSSSGNKQIYTWSSSDANWRIGMSASPGFTTSMATSNVQYLTYANYPGQGFAIGVNGGQSSFEITGGNHNAFFRGNVGIGTTNPDALLAVKGQVHANEVKVDLTVPGPDYVFEKDYKLTSLEEIKNYIDQNKHLPEVPSAKEMEKNGVQLGEMNMLLLKKIEELTLYVIEQNKKIEELNLRDLSRQKEIENLRNKK